MQVNSHSIKKTWFWDAACLALFFIIALVYTCGRVGLHFNDHLLSSSDAANIASFSAALDHPGSFANDSLLNNPANFSFYSTLHVPLIRALAKWFGNYSTPFAFLIFPVTLLHLIGYYWLGREVLKDRWFALIFSLMVLIPVQLNLSEIWGLWQDVIPRFLFQSLLPFELAAVMRWGKKPKSWPWLMAAMGLLIYIHPVSLPAWALAVILSLWIMAPAMPKKQKLLHLVLAGLLFLVVVLPFAFNYLSTTTFGSRGSIPYAELMDILRKRLITGFLDLNIAFKDFIKIAVISDWLMILLWAFVFIGGLVFFFFFIRQKKDKTTLLVLGSMWFSIFFVSVVLPLLDHSLAARLQRLPYEFDLVRNLRFSIPLLLLSALYLLIQIQVESKRRWGKSRSNVISFTFALAGLLFLTGWAVRNILSNEPAFAQTARCWSSGQWVCPFPQEANIVRQIDLLEKIKELTPTGAKFLAAADTSELMIRYFSLRPLIYSYKDGGSFIYANLNSLRLWWQQYNEISQVQSYNSRAAYLDGLLAFARKYHADYLVLEEQFDPQKYYPGNINNIYSNAEFTLFKLAE